ncbi:MAG: ParB N-terminal domain-containing protein [Planctomycetes bacterium]|nr:ParB N-terminal domain-containing protein [Planctomycetota bacterium]
MRENIIRPMQERKYGTVPIDEIKVLNSRNRNKKKFDENIRSIKDVGLLKPILVNERHYEKNGYYELVCGQGRYLAYKALGHDNIPAEVINCTAKNAYLYSLVENIARVPPGTMWFAREVKRLKDSGMSYADIGKITGKGETYLREYIFLADHGEERLIKGVEAGLFPISFAKKVAHAETTSVQNILMDAFDCNIVNSNNFPTVKKIIERRITQSESVNKRTSGHSLLGQNYTIEQLKHDINKMTKEKEAFVNEAEVKENRLLSLLYGLHLLWKDNKLIELVKSEEIGPLPQLKGNYHVT